jgi:hypothetical protein
MAIPKNIPLMRLHVPEGFETKLSKEDFVREGLSEIVGDRMANGVKTTKKDLKRFQKSLEDDWDFHKIS